ncbi:MAG: hypothetical protein U0R26_08875 [Solirubrobacterales bacterium]
MDSQQTPIDSRPPHTRALRGAGEGARLAFEEHVIWRGGDAIRALVDFLGGCLEAIGFAIRRWLIWPVQDRAPLLSGRGQVLAVGAVVVAAAAAGVAGLLWVASGSSGSPAATRAAAPSKPLADTSAPPPKAPPAPTLHGAAPVFAPTTGKGSSGVDGAKPIKSSPSHPSGSTSTAAPSSAATDKISSSPSPSSSSAQASTSAVEGPPAGPAAIAVAREFAGAFVVYETGGEKSAVRKTFTATATQELTRSLLRRPPRQPANVKVPRAKVVNVVAAPSHGPVYTVSVSLLRVGVTSELRLDMEQLKNNRWRVTNVLG